MEVSTNIRTKINIPNFSYVQNNFFPNHNSIPLFGSKHRKKPKITKKKRSL
jgi:hypothetical protein